MTATVWAIGVQESAGTGIVGQVITGLILLVFNGAFLAAALKYLVDRRINKARTMVETSTVDLKIDAAEIQNEAARLANVEQRITLIQSAHTSERESWYAQLQELRGRVAELEHRDQASRARQKAMADYIRLLRVTFVSAAPTYPVPAVPAGIELD